MVHVLEVETVSMYWDRMVTLDITLSVGFHFLGYFSVTLTFVSFNQLYDDRLLKKRGGVFLFSFFILCV